MPLWKSLLYFGIPVVIVLILVYAVMPFFDEQGLPIFYNYFLVYATLPMLVMIATAFIAYKLEGHPLSGLEIRKRFRLNKMGRKSWLWTFGLMAFMLLTAGLLSPTASWLAFSLHLVPPESWPAELNPLKSSGPDMGTIPTNFLGIPLAGQWWVFMFLLTSLVIATFGEELWWRGIILPRQELTHGKGTWIIHGLLWTLFHIFTPWNLITLLPGCLALAYVAQRLKNTWPGIIAHGLTNGLPVLTMVLLGILQ